MSAPSQTTKILPAVTWNSSLRPQRVITMTVPDRNYENYEKLRNLWAFILFGSII